VQDDGGMDGAGLLRVTVVAVTTWLGGQVGGVIPSQHHSHTRPCFKTVSASK